MNDVIGRTAQASRHALACQWTRSSRRSCGQSWQSHAFACLPTAHATVIALLIAPECSTLTSCLPSQQLRSYPLVFLLLARQPSPPRLLQRRIGPVYGGVAAGGECGTVALRLQLAPQAWITLGTGGGEGENGREDVGGKGRGSGLGVGVESACGQRVVATSTTWANGQAPVAL